MAHQNKSQGLGDSIHKFTSVTGMKSVVERGARALGSDCGCDNRRDTLNRMFPYKNKN